MEADMKRMLMLVLALCPVVAAQTPCTVASVRGTYVVSYSGWALMPEQGAPLPLTVPGVILGVVSIGHDGSLSGGETMIVAGQTQEYLITGTVEINSDCTGTLRISTKVKGSSDKPSPVTERFAAVVSGVSGQDVEIRTTILSSPTPAVAAMGLGLWRRMSPVPGSATW
jgi:hypothetical protein